MQKTIPLLIAYLLKCPSHISTVYRLCCSLQLPVDVILLNIREGSQRLHASRRVFDTLQREGITTAVIHHITFKEGTPR